MYNRRILSASVTEHVVFSPTHKNYYLSIKKHQSYDLFLQFFTLQHHSGPLFCLQPVPAVQSIHSAHQGFALSLHCLLRSFIELIADLIGSFLDIDFIDPECLQDLSLSRGNCIVQQVPVI